MHLPSVAAAALDLVLPQDCAGCGAVGTRWCWGCATELRRAASGPLGPCAPDPVPRGFPRAAAASAYDGAVRGALLAHKERGRLGLVHPLGDALAAAVASLHLPGPVLLVPVPSSRQAVRDRGHDHARRLSRSAARRLRAGGIEARSAPLLLHARRVVDQAGLGTAARAANLSGAFRCREVPAGLHVVLVDDVVTTGATLVEAARAVTAAGGRVHGAATVAATRRRPPATGATRSGSPSVHRAIGGLPSEGGAGDGAARRFGPDDGR